MHMAADAGLRIDHFLLSPKLDKRLIAAGVDRNVRGWEKTSTRPGVDRVEKLGRMVVSA